MTSLAWGSRTVSAGHGVAAGGDIRDSTISVVNGISPEQAAEFVRLAVSGRPGDNTELLRRLDAMVPADSRLRVEALARFFAILGEAEVPPEQLTDRLVEIAGRYQELLAWFENTSSADPEVRRIKVEAREALDAGDFARAETLLNQAKARDLSAIDQMQADLDARKFSAADAAAGNGALMMTQLRYAEAAHYYAEAVGLTPETYPAPLSDLLTGWTVAAWRAGDYRTAEDAARRALTLDEARLPADDVQLGSRLNNLAALYRETGRFAESEPLYVRAIRIGDQALGPEHPGLASSLNNLAELYRQTGRYADAEPLYRRTLTIGEQALGPDHPDIVTWLNNLALLYQVTGRFAEAEPLYERVLAIDEQALGPEHPDVAVALNNLAGLYGETGRHAEAEPLYRCALAISERAFGPEHPTVATVINNLALLLQKLGRVTEAEPLSRRAVALRERALGPGHPDLASSLNNLATLYQKAGRHIEAEPLYARSIAIAGKTLPAEHPHRWTAVENYASLLDESGRGDEAARLRAGAEAAQQPPAAAAPTLGVRILPEGDLDRA